MILERRGKKIEDIKEILEAKNIKPSIARVKILEYLTRGRNHPTVDEIYNNVVSDVPTLSKTTVYNSLDLFKNAELVRVINLGDNENRYDASVSTHGHFKCNECGRVYDFWINTAHLEVNGLEKFKINEKNVYYRGVCPRCLSR